MDKAEQAYEAAKAEIARVKAEGGDEIDLVKGHFRALKNLPPELSSLTKLRTLGLTGTGVMDLSPVARLRQLQMIALAKTKIGDISCLAELTDLKTLYLRDTQISDLAPLTKLKDLQTLTLDNTQVLDLRPVAKLEKLGTGQALSISFRNTEATNRDAQLAKLADIYDEVTRARLTLEYLRSLPPWPEPYTPAATPDGSPPKPIGGVPEREKIKTAQTQIQHLIRNATVTRVTAQTFATQIEEALRGVPATHDNELAEPLQTMQEFAGALRNLAPANEPASDPLYRAHLELRISYLEALVDRLTHQLADETKAREAAEALAKKEGFAATHTKAFAAEAGKWNARLIYIGVPSAAFYFLGAENPLAVLLSKVMAGAIK